MLAASDRDAEETEAVDGWVPDGQSALLGYQRSWYYDRSPIKVIAKSRQVGITWTSALEAVDVAATRRSDGGMNVYFMTTSRDDARDFILDCAGWVRTLTPVIDGLLEDVEIQESDDWFEDDDGNSLLAFRIDFPSGFSIYALPSRPARLRGKKRCLIIVDEAAQQDLDAVLTAAGGALIWGGRLAFISTYLGTSNGFYRLVQAIKSREQGGKLHEVSIYDALADGLYKRICSTQGKSWSPEAEEAWVEFLRKFYGPHRFRQECECIPDGGGGQLIPKSTVLACASLTSLECTVFEVRGGAEPCAWVDRALIGTSADPWGGDGSAELAKMIEVAKSWLDRHVQPVIDRLNAEHLPVHAGLDYGRTRNLSSFMIGVLGRDLRRKIRLVVELEDVPWPVQDFIQDWLWGKITNLRAGCADAQGLGGDSAERCAVKTGGKIKPVKISSSWHEPNITSLIKRLEDGSLLLPAHFGPLVDDLTSLRHDGRRITAAQRVTMDDRKQKRHADGAIALALFEQSVAADGPAMVEPRRPRRRTRRINRGGAYR